MGNMIKKSKRVKQNLDVVLLGSEPVVERIEGRNDPQLTRIFNWYNYMCDDKQSQNWLVQWMKSQKYDKDTIDIVRNSPDWSHGSTAGWYAKMILNGTDVDESCVEYIRDKIKFVVGRYSEDSSEESSEPSNVIDLQGRIKNKNRQVMALAEEEVIDAFADSGYDPSSYSMYDFLIKHTVSSQVASQMRSFYKPHLDELMSDDPQVKEAFGKTLKNCQKFYSQLISDLDRYLNNKKVVRVKKPKVIKIKPASKIVEKVQYLKEFGDLKLVSVDPGSILAAKTLWAYNVKSKILTLYQADDPNGFGVKGTTLTGWSESLSIGKRLRKPEMVINEVLTAGKVAIKRIIPDLKTTEIKPNGRINKDTILLKVTK